MNKRLLLVLLLALVLRLGFGLAQDPLEPYTDFSGDTGWYLANAYELITGLRPGETLALTERFANANWLDAYVMVTGRSVSYITQVSGINSPPLYLILIGVAEVVLPRAEAMIAVRVLQAVLATLTCYCAYRLARRLTGREAAGLLAALLLAVSPVFIIEAAQILTETLFVFLLVGGIWLYVESLVSGRQTWALLVLAAVLLGAGTLTRAVLLAFPLGLAVHLLLVYGWRKGLGRAAAFGLVYALVVLTWTAYTVTQWNRFVIAGEGRGALEVVERVCTQGLDLLHFTRRLVVIFTDNQRVKVLAGTCQRINRREDTACCNRTFQRDGTVKVGEHGHRRRVGVIVCRYIHRLDRGDRTLSCGGNTFLQLAHFVSQRWLITNC